MPRFRACLNLSMSSDFVTERLTYYFAAQKASGPGLSLNLVKLYLFIRSVNKSENYFVEIDPSIIARINLEQSDIRNIPQFKGISELCLS